MRSVGAFEAKTHLSQLLDEVARGERIAITRHGIPVAMLVPARPDQPDVRATIQALMRVSRQLHLNGLKVRDLVEEGRRW